MRLHAAGVYGAGEGAYEQALAMFGAAEDLLRRAGMEFRDVVRTWIHLREMDRDYAELNRARRAFFGERGIDPPPASTGIGGGTVPATHDLGLGLYALTSDRPPARTVMSAATLNEAPDYGADFVRGMRVVEANKDALYVSGTASVDEAGRTAHPGDLDAQVDRMLVNVAALLERQGAGFGDVVSAVTYLKLGCGTGANLIAFAARNPGATCVGIDLSENSVNIGRGGVAELGLDNIALRQGDIAALDAEELGTFDFIIANGVYTWVPVSVRPKLLDIARHCLAANGLAAFGYHTLPGWRFSGAVGEMLRDLTRGAADRPEKIRLARERLEFIAGASTIDKSFYGDHLRTAAERIRKKTDIDFYHEYLDTVNFPVYFHEFMAAADNHGLTYVWDSDIDTGFVDNLPPPIAGGLRQRAAGLIEIEQLMDYLRNRRWRNSILCRRERTPRHDLDPGAIRGFRIAADLTRSGAPAGGAGTVFKDRRGSTITAPDPATLAALSRVAEAWPQDVAFDDLARDPAIGAANVELVAAGLLRLSFLGSCFLYSEPVAVSATVSERPTASALARWRAGKGPDVVNQHHMTVSLDPAARRLIALLDGARDRAALMRELAPQAASERPDSLNSGLEKLRRAALLVG